MAVRASRRAVFLDRDGVLNHNIWYGDTQAWESPRLPSEFVLTQGMAAALARLRDAGYLLFLVSNQPNVAKGKAKPGALEAMQASLQAELAKWGVVLAGVFYCPHHPEFTGACACRKPNPFFLTEAVRTHDLALPQCWMIGDRATDLECGRAAGVRTGWIATGQEKSIPTPDLIDLGSDTLPGLIDKILAEAPG